MKLLFLTFVCIVVLSSSVLAASSFYGTSSGTAQFVNYQTSPDFQRYYSSSQIQDYWPILQQQQQACEGRQDLLIQVAPLGCQPSVVRSDLLAEQNVPVFCQLDALRLNPLLDIKQIRSINFNGQYPSSVVGVGFHPAQAALRTSNELLGSPVLNNIGYVVVLLKRNPNETALPAFINFTLGAKIDYYAGNAAGIGASSFFLSSVSDQDWKFARNKQSFLNGRFFVRLEEADDQQARVAIYDGDYKVTSTTVRIGQTSGPIYLPGLYCDGRVQIAFQGYRAAQKTVRLQVDDDVLTLYEGGTFLNNKCSVRGIISENNLTSRVELSCGSQQFTLRLSPRQFVAGNDVYVLSDAGEVEQGLGVWKIAEVKKNKDGLVTGYTLSKAGEQPREVSANQLRSVSGDVLNEVQYDRDTEVYFKNALDSYKRVVSDYPLERQNGVTLDVPAFGEQALERSIKLAEQFGKQRTAVELINTYLATYPSARNNSYFVNRLDNLYRYDSSSAVATVDIDNGVKTIRLLEVVENAQQSKAAFSWGGSGVFDLALHTSKNIEGLGNVTLDRLEKDQASLTVICSVGGRRQVENPTFILGRGTRVISDADRAKNVCGQTLRIESIDLQAFADIRISPVTSRPNSVVNFSVGVGIEKRAIKLTPDKTQDRINELNKTIQKWDRLSTNLGNVVTGMKAACFATAGVLTVKNFVTGLSGEALARQKVMGGPNGWTKYCTDAVNRGEYGKSINKCYSDNSANIAADVKVANDRIKADNAKIKEIEGQLKKSSGVFGEYVDGEAAKDAFVANELGAGYGSKTVKLADGTSKPVSELTQEVNDGSGSKKRMLSYDEAKDLKFYLDVRDDPASSAVAKKNAEVNLERIGNAVNDRVRGTETRSSLVTSLKGSDLGKSIGTYGSRFSQTGEYSGAQVSASDLSKIKGLPSEYAPGKSIAGAPAQLITVDSTPYLVVLDATSDNNYRVAKTYKLTEAAGGTLEAQAVDSIPNAQFSTFKKVSRADCRNTITNPKVQFYETEPYAGMPAIVPFDTTEGWYVATRQTLPAFGSIKAFQSSGRPVSFWVCNVGKDHEIDFFVSGFDDDICQQFNLETGAALNKFSCLSESETTDVVNRAYRALQDAAQQRSQGAKSFVRIEGKSLGVGSPAVNVPGTQCQDFMSPDDCKILFNVCDPVICPSSRCNFGGQFPVADVIQSGVIGSTLLCLPNIKEGILVPVCLSGIKAGLDGYLSILKSYQQCLQESLTTGQNVGICDEISSVYMCEFFWRQAAPVANVLLPKAVEFAYGQNQIQGGGEYLSVQSAWNNAQSSVNYFTQTYAVNSLQAFNVRSVEEAGTDVCRAFISAKAPTNFKALIEPDSPPQFTAWFSAIPYSDATVPATSQYKVFYHIFAGNDQGVGYTVYLKDPPQTSYYQTTATIQVAGGYITKGQFKTETKDFTAPAGYKQLCVRINDKEECGFKEVTSDAALTYIKDSVVSSQIKQTDVTSESQCVSGTTNAASLLNVNPGEVGAEAADPAIYNRGITRICATNNPGQNTDPKRFVDVGVCGDAKIRCWLDTQSVANAISANDNLVRNQTLAAVEVRAQQQFEDSAQYTLGQAAETSLGDLRTRVQTSTAVNAPAGEKLITEIDTLFVKVVINSQKAELIFLKSIVYENVARTLRGDTRPALNGNQNPGTTVGVTPPAPVAPRGLSLSSSYTSQSNERIAILNDGADTGVYIQGTKVFSSRFSSKQVGRIVQGTTIELDNSATGDLGNLFDLLNGATIQGSSLTVATHSVTLGSSCSLSFVQGSTSVSGTEITFGSAPFEVSLKGCDAAANLTLYLVFNRTSDSKIFTLEIVPVSSILQQQSTSFSAGELARASNNEFPAIGTLAAYILNKDGSHLAETSVIIRGKVEGETTSGIIVRTS